MFLLNRIVAKDPELWRDDRSSGSFRRNWRSGSPSWNYCLPDTTPDQAWAAVWRVLFFILQFYCFKQVSAFVSFFCSFSPLWVFTRLWVIERLCLHLAHFLILIPAAQLSFTESSVQRGWGRRGVKGITWFLNSTFSPPNRLLCCRNVASVKKDKMRRFYSNLCLSLLLKRKIKINFSQVKNIKMQNIKLPVNVIKHYVKAAKAN